MYRRILVPVDGSATSNAGLDRAIELAKLTGGQLRLLHVVDELPFVMSAEGYSAMTTDVLGLLREAGQRILAQAQARVEASGIAVETLLFDSLDGRLSDRVAEQANAWPADLIVLGTHGRRGLRRALLGSDAEQVLRTAPVPVLLIRANPADASAKP